MAEIELDEGEQQQVGLELADPDVLARQGAWQEDRGLARRLLMYPRMRFDVCQRVSACLVLLLGACASTTHATPDAGEDAGAMVDGGSDDGGRADAALPDAGGPDATAPDAGGHDGATPDAGINPPFTPMVWCTATPGGVLADSASALTLSYDGCCIDDVVCTARADTASAVLDLAVTADDYSEVCDCDPNAVEISCDLPPLGAGIWTVRVNGVHGFELPVLETVSEEPGKLCFDPAAPPQGMLRCETPPAPWPNVGEACHYRQGIDASHAGVRLVDGCGGCFEHFAGCSIAIDGSSLHVTPLKQACSCDTCGACPEICMRSEAVCSLPPLPVGDYTISVEGIDGDTALEIVDYQMLAGRLDITEVCSTGP